MKSSYTSMRPGFSMVELMVVIAIIAILIALLIPGVNIVMIKAKNAAIKLEIANLASSLERYKLDYNEYPPDFTSGDPLAEINAHLARNFRYRDARYDVPQNDISTLDPLEALYFWLKGFSPDPQRPVGGMGERTPLFEFDQARLTDRDNDGHPEYVPPRAQNIPYVYYRHQSYPAATVWAQRFSESGSLVVAKPYFSEMSSAAAAAKATTGQPSDVLIPSGTAQPFGTTSFYAEANKFQIISAGLDGEYGTGAGLYPSGQGYTEADRDNIANFIQGGTLEDDIP